MSRRRKSRRIRRKAAKIAFERSKADNVKHKSNGEEQNLPMKMMSFTKGLPHDETTGLIQSENHFEAFRNGICSGNPDEIAKTPLGPTETFVSIDDKTARKQFWKSAKGKEKNIVRAWESSGAGLTFDLQGPDAQAVTMKAAPTLGSDELAAEMAEVYCQAVLRDIPFADFKNNASVSQCLEVLNSLSHFKNGKRNGNRLTANNAFRGFTLGDLKGPYISQFLLAGNNGLGNEFKASDGYINYGSLLIDQRVRSAKKDLDYMTTWNEYLDVQNGADFRELEEYEETVPKRRFITSGRDLATYVHYDALYEAYLNACLLLLGAKAPFDKGVPFQDSDGEDKQQGFAHYGGPHILTLVTEVATRALKAVRYQKFNVHLRLRPEALAARMEKKNEIVARLSDYNTSLLENTYNELEAAGMFNLLGENKLLPMAYCEGSPMHPSYGAGHATVAGACVTILKAFFNHKALVNVSSNGEKLEVKTDGISSSHLFVPNATGTALEIETCNEIVTLEDELNKLAANISIGRNWAGVHYYTDYTESLLLGEEIAIGLLEEQAITYNPDENFKLTLPRFKGGTVIIDRNGVRPDDDDIT